MPSKSPRGRSSDGFMIPKNPQIRREPSPARENRAHSEQPSQKTGCFPYRLVNSLLNAVLPKDLRKAIFNTGAFERRPSRQTLAQDPRALQLSRQCIDGYRPYSPRPYSSTRRNARSAPVISRRYEMIDNAAKNANVHHITACWSKPADNALTMA